MITYIKIDGFKTFKNFEMYFSPFTVIAGVNAAGKSNLFDALALMTELAFGNSIQKVLSSQRGELDELFTLFDNGKRATEMSFVVEMLVNPMVTDEWNQSEKVSVTRLRYEVALKYVGVDNVEIVRESLCPIRKKDDKWASYLPNKTDSHWRPAMKGTRQKPFLSFNSDESVTVSIYDNNDGKIDNMSASGSNLTFISRFSKSDTPHLLAARMEMMSWRFLHLNPDDLRRPSFKSESMFDLDSTGKNLAATLNRLKKEDEYNLVIISQLIRRFIPDYIAIDVKEESDRSRYVLYVTDRRHEKYTSRVLSEGTLRIIALCVLAVDNHHSGLLCFEEPENGIHPMRLEVMANLMEQLSSDFMNTELKLRQVIVNTHSPRFVEEVFKLHNPLCTVILTRRVTSIINESEEKKMLQSTRMTPIVSDGKYVYPLASQYSIQDLKLTRQEMMRYLNKTTLTDILG
ncbi:MAG: AAA family ATPase [Bacteroidaceae bacterium]|nr:AAA family ATPase [Bacteroidaceae bacterium]